VGVLLPHAPGCQMLPFSAVPSARLTLRPAGVLGGAHAVCSVCILRDPNQIHTAERALGGGATTHQA
jgi:hypothetical protein